MKLESMVVRVALRGGVAPARLFARAFGNPQGTHVRHNMFGSKCQAARSLVTRPLMESAKQTLRKVSTVQASSFSTSASNVCAGGGSMFRRALSRARLHTHGYTKGALGISKPLLDKKVEEKFLYGTPRGANFGQD